MYSKEALKALLCTEFAINKSDIFDLRTLSLLVLYRDWGQKSGTVLCEEKEIPKTLHKHTLRKDSCISQKKS